MYVPRVTTKYPSRSCLVELLAYYYYIHLTCSPLHTRRNSIYTKPKAMQGLWSCGEMEFVGEEIWCISPSTWEHFGPLPIYPTSYELRLFLNAISSCQLYIVSLGHLSGPNLTYILDVVECFVASCDLKWKWGINVLFSFRVFEGGQSLSVADVL